MNILRRLRAISKAARLGFAAALAGSVAFPVGAVVPSTLYVFECWRPDGSLRWREEVPNLVVNEGLNDLLDKYFKGSTYTASHFVGLTQGSPTFAAGDTLASNAGWDEFTSYSGNRKTFTPGTVASQSVSNSASAAVFAITGSGTVGGGFLCTVNTGTSGILYGGAAFSGGNRTVDNGDTLTVTATATAAAA